MEDLEIKKLEIGFSSDEKEVCINVGGHGGDTEFLDKKECQQVIDYLSEAIKHLK